jgi:hypothetical protein
MLLPKAEKSENRVEPLDLSILSAVLVWFSLLIPATTAFAPQIFSSTTSRQIESSTPLYGAFLLLRKRIKRVCKPSPLLLPPRSANPHFPLQVVNSETATAVAELESELEAMHQHT